MGARQHSDLNPDIANLVELAPVRTATVFDHLRTEDLLAQKIEVLASLLAPSFVLFGNGALDFVFELLDERVALVLGMLLGVDGVKQAIAQPGTKLAKIGLVNHDRLDGPLRLTNSFRQVADRSADLLDLLMAELDALHYGFFRNFLSAGLDHDNAVSGADHHQIQLPRPLLIVGGIDDEISVHLADTNRADGAVKWNVGDAQCNRGTVDARNIGIVLRVRRKDHGNDLG